MKRLVMMMAALFFAGSLMAATQVDTTKNNKDQKKDQKKEQKKEEKKIVNDPEMVKKLETITVPKVDFQKISISTAVKQLNELAMLNDSEKKGVIFSLDADDQMAASASIITFSKEKVNLETILKAVCQQAGYTYLATPDGVKLSKPDNGKKKGAEKL